MSENCRSCGKRFSWLRKKNHCQLCQEELCRDCVSQTTLSWGILDYQHITRIEGATYELVLGNNNMVGYRVMRPLDFPKIYTLCNPCKDKMSERIIGFKAEINNRLASIIVTPRSHVPGYRVIKSLGIVEYFPRGAGTPLLSSRYNIGPISFLKTEALKRGANALINYQETHIKRLNQYIPPKLKGTWEDFIPGFREQKYQKYQYQQPTYTKIPVFKAKAVIVRKIQD